MFHDVSDRKRAEQEREEALFAAKEASQAKSMFLASMSHEIRTPLGGIIGFSELGLGDDALSDASKKYLINIKNSADGLLEIINNILDISKIEAGKMELRHEPFDLNDVLRACKSIIEPKAMEKSVAVFFYSEAMPHRQLVGDSVKLRQVLLNLMSNAVKFTNHGMIKVTITVKEQENERLVVRFEVRDSGIGMTPGQLEHIFEAFVQASTGRTRQYEGTGLGLALSRQFVEAMGGVLQAESTPGLGSKMTEPDNVLTVSFEGKSPADLKMSVRKDGGDIDALTASTITSKAYIDAVDRAWRVFSNEVRGVQVEATSGATANAADASTGATTAATPAETAENQDSASHE